MKYSSLDSSFYTQGWYLFWNCMCFHYLSFSLSTYVDVFYIRHNLPLVVFLLRTKGFYSSAINENPRSVVYKKNLMGEYP